MTTFRQRLGEIRETDRANQDKLSRLIDDLQTEKVRAGLNLALERVRVIGGAL